MIAKRIEVLIKRLEKLKNQVEPSTWTMIRNATAELIDIAANVRTVELRLRDSSPASGLGMAEAFTEPDEDGNFKVNMARVGRVLGDIAQLLRDNGRQPPQPLKRKSQTRGGRQSGLTLVPGKEAVL